MKKRKLIEKRRALREAYLNELKKLGVVDTPEVKTYQEMTKAELIEEGKALGITLDMKLTKAEMIASIECHNEPVEGFAVTEEDDGNIHVRPVVDGEIIDTPVEQIIKEDEEESKEDK